MIKDLLVDIVKNWKYNRPSDMTRCPDMARCPNIARYIYNSVDTMVYLSFTNIKEVFEKAFANMCSIK